MSNISTPISRIPPETLSEIFVQCLPVDSAPQNTQRLLSRVCSLWRSLVLATPILWASLDIGDHRGVLGPPLAVIHAHLQRSGTHPFPSLYRWHKVHIKLVGMTQDILDLIMLGDAPLLHSMQYDIMEARDFPIPFRMLHCCPRLESFQSRSFGSPLLLPLIDTSLTSLSLQTFLSVSECVSLLRLSPRLSSAKFDGLCCPNSSPVPHLTHPTLSTLTALGDHSPTLLAALTLPSLLNLTTEIEHPVTPLPGGWETTLPAFLERSNPTLHQLSLSPVASPRNVLAIQHRTHIAALWGFGLSRWDVHRDAPARWGAQTYANGVACLERVDIGLKVAPYDRSKADMKKLCAEGMRGGFYLEVPW
ncbi:hypothetical protein BD779DRAFT_1784059 [Infundibulicybe gibba]|nr:hypothetical protein BD779DRAFT_1784059 [Infundibulicybe gibba]